MSETTTETTEETGPTTAELAARVDGIDSKLDTVLAAITGKKDGDPKPPTPGQPEQPTGIADEIRRQLEERDRKTASDKAAADAEEWKAGVTKTLGDLTEQKPEPPQRGIEKLMWGRR